MPEQIWRSAHLRPCEVAAADDTGHLYLAWLQRSRRMRAVWISNELGRNGTTFIETLHEDWKGPPTFFLSHAWGQTFHDIPTAIWYNLVTITTVGYGDVYPTTERGRSFAMVVIVCGVVVFLPIPLAIVGNTFTRVWEERQQVKLRGILRQMLTEQGISPTDFTQAFVQFDTDGNGTIEREEFYEIVETHMNLGLSKKDMRAMWRCIDVDGDNSIDIVEFAAVCFPDVDATEPSATRQQHARTLLRLCSMPRESPLVQPPTDEQFSFLWHWLRERVA